jgi:glycosyltransferase involved in cell wall biosynthesis
VIGEIARQNSERDARAAIAIGVESHRAFPLRFSVVVPVFEQWHLVPTLLDCLRHQTFPEERFEVIFVDNGSSVFLEPIDLPENASLYGCRTAGAYAARNHGVDQAKGEWLAFTDADCLPSPEWLSELDRAAAAAQGPVLLAGSVKMQVSSERPSPWEIYDVVKGLPQERYVRRGYAATANLAVPRSLFTSLGGFVESRYSGGDAEFCRRASRVNAKVELVEDARVGHRSRVTWREIEIKARRVKGGQLTGGSFKNRVIWSFRTLMPPVQGLWRFLRSRQHPVRHRLIAILVLFRVWMVEVTEAGRLILGHPAERR